MARSAVADGIRTLAATPHVRDDYPTTAGEMEAALEALRGALSARASSSSSCRAGSWRWSGSAGSRPTSFAASASAATTTGCSSSFRTPAGRSACCRVAERLAGDGFGIVLAHPERNPEVQAVPTNLHEFVDGGMLVQLTAASVDGRLGKRARETSIALLDLGLAHLLASDAHAPSIREIGLSAAVESIGDDELARWLTEDVPAAIIAGAPLPERPSGP